MLYGAGVLANLAFVVAVVLPLGLGLLARLRAGDRSPALLTAVAGVVGFAVLPSAMFGVVNVGERLLISALLVGLVLSPGPWRALGAGVALLAPVTVLWLHLVLPAEPPRAEIGHLAAHDPGQRLRLLFWAPAVPVPGAVRGGDARHAGQAGLHHVDRADHARARCCTLSRMGESFPYEHSVRPGETA